MNRMFSLALALTVLSQAELRAVELLEPQDGATVAQLTEAQREYIAMPLAERRLKFADRIFRAKELGVSPQASGAERRKSWWPKPVLLTWKAEPGVTYAVRVAEKKTGAVWTERQVTGGELAVDSLKIATEYEWTVSDAKGSASRVFVTEDLAPRLIADPRVPNVRDLGGRIGLGGRRVKQGLAIRSAGLNGNARTGVFDPKALAKEDPKGAIAALKPRQEALAGLWRGLVEKGGSFGLVNIRLPGSWSVRRLPDGLSQLRAMASLAETLTGMEEAGGSPAAETVEADDENRLRLGEPGDGRWCFVRGVVEAEEDGFAQLGVAADWYWAMAVNGTVVRDRIAGNSMEFAAFLHELTFPVRKGPNEILLVVGSGSLGYMLRFGSFQMSAKPRHAADEGKVAKEMVEGLARHAGGYEKGETRIGDDNRDFWLKTLGVRTDIDLRSDRECRGMTESPLGPTVAWRKISSNAYAGMASDIGRESFAKVFRVFLDERNYPIDFHCIAGQDRTGAVAFILNALLGVSENELYLDWELSGLWNRNPDFNHAKRFDRLTKVFTEGYPAATIHESVEAYVLSLGFTKEEIGRFREFMLE